MGLSACTALLRDSKEIQAPVDGAHRHVACTASVCYLSAQAELLKYISRKEMGTSFHIAHSDRWTRRFVLGHYRLVKSLR